MLGSDSIRDRCVVLAVLAGIAAYLTPHHRLVPPDLLTDHPIAESLTVTGRDHRPVLTRQPPPTRPPTRRRDPDSGPHGHGDREAGRDGGRDGRQQATTVPSSKLKFHPPTLSPPPRRPLRRHAHLDSSLPQAQASTYQTNQPIPGLHTMSHPNAPI